MTIVEFSEGAVVGQEFVPDFDHLRAVTVWMRVDRPVDVEVLCSLLSVSDGGAPLYKWTERVHVEGRSSQTFEFPSLVRSSGRRFRFELRLSRPTPGLTLEAWGTDAVRPGFLVVDGHERWGDLVYRARAATLAEVLASTPRAIPGMLRQPVVLLALVALHAMALVMFWTGLVRRRVDDDPEQAGVSRGQVFGIVGVALGASVLVFVWYSAPASGASDLDLLGRFDEAEKQADIPLERAFEVGDVTIGGDTRRVIGAHPTSRIVWRVEVPADAWLRTALAMRPDAWGTEGDGVRFRVGVVEGDRVRVLSSHYIDPKGHADERRWIPLRVDLSRYAGQTIDLVLGTDPGPEGDTDARSDWAVWAAPAIVVGRPEA